ncbi:DUF3265 domain-containing protein [Vibrio alginolyticus]|nr:MULTISPECIES: DUF3265 domain-containing protein [Vibrio harveyi group]EGQ7844837.1 DUF3265 domain-containing protein [Vibrio alginolyticus]EGQ8472813.1 DUF3265 domain-containing protein [Vibrio alginolyticus]EGQ8986632.1 DUF3265 domain-containing protein [Vibrio alginolyticus]EGQ9216523.1 DUF3265 domain-containing protein [Vibrio alginolyticus]EGR0307144.1 DUF3265 domain-containing protein [Vibrio alginolyticus]
MVLLARVSYVVVGRIGITNCLRVIRNAWHFYYALVLVFKVVCSGIGIALLTP